MRPPVRLSRVQYAVLERMDELAATGQLAYDETRQDIEVTDDENDAPDSALICDEDGWRLRVGDRWIAVSSPARPQIDEAAAALPRRVAHALHALLEAGAAAGVALVASSAVCAYDAEAKNVRATAAALTQAKRLGLASFSGRYWFARPPARELRTALEERYLAEVEGV